MNALTIFALAAAFFAIAIGFATIIGESGYSFDLRKKGFRKKAPNYGRRESDLKA